MSKIITSLALLSIGIVGYAQDTPPTGRVGINTTTPQGTLEIAAPRNDSKGLLDTKNNGVVIPTLTKKEVASLTKPVDGTLVFITDEEENVTTTNQISDISNVSGNGFYYYVATGENKGTWASSGSTYVRNENKDVSFSASGCSVVNRRLYVLTSTGRACCADTQCRVPFTFLILASVPLPDLESLS